MDIRIRKSIFIPMSLIFLTAIVLGLVNPSGFYNAENYIVGIAFKYFGWLFQLSSVAFFFACIYLMCSKFGNIRFGGESARPSMNRWSWFSITLCAGIGTGIMFWGIAEPITHFMNPPDFSGLKAGSEKSAVLSLVISYVHWTFLPYSIYALVGVGAAYITYNLKLPFRVSSILHPLLGKYMNKKIESIIDNVSIFAMAGGVSAILGVATLQLGSGIDILLGVKPTKILWILICSAIVIFFIASSYLGLNKGMKWLSDKNAKIYLLILLFIFIFGPTSFILSLGTQSIGSFFDTFFERTTVLSPIEGSEWPRWWPIYYWAIWIAYAPIAGMFFGSIARGRTIREFLTINMIAPAVFGIIWFSIFGGAAIYQQLYTDSNLWGVIQEKGLEASIYAFLGQYPLPTILSYIMIITILLSVVTLCDSMTGTIAKMSTRGDYSDNKEAPRVYKVFWGLVISSLAIINILAPEGKISGIDATKMISTVAGFPILFLMIAIGICVIVMLSRDKKLYKYKIHPLGSIEDQIKLKEETRDPEKTEKIMNGLKDQISSLRK